MARRPVPPRETEPEQPGSVPSPVELLLDQLERRLALRRRDALGRIQGLKAALDSYERAVEEQFVREVARDHHLPLPKLAGVEPEQAAARLRDLVLGLPELTASPTASPKTPHPAEGTVDNQEHGAVQSARARNVTSSDSNAHFPHLVRRLEDGKLVVVGVFAGRHREAIPAELHQRTEWVDTESGGVHAIGNLPQRIRQGRVAALVILDRAVQHKHTEPLVAAARAMAVPVGFAGKGGMGGMRQALESLEAHLVRGEK